MVLVVWWRILWGSRVGRLETWAKTRREKIPPRHGPSLCVLFSTLGRCWDALSYGQRFWVERLEFEMSPQYASYP